MSLAADAAHASQTSILVNLIRNLPNAIRKPLSNLTYAKKNTAARYFGSPSQLLLGHHTMSLRDALSALCDGKNDRYERDSLRLQRYLNGFFGVWELSQALTAWANTMSCRFRISYSKEACFASS